MVILSINEDAEKSQDSARQLLLTDNEEKEDYHTNATSDRHSGDYLAQPYS